LRVLLHHLHHHLLHHHLLLLELLLHGSLLWVQRRANTLPDPQPDSRAGQRPASPWILGGGLGNIQAADALVGLNAHIVAQFINRRLFGRERLDLDGLEAHTQRIEFLVQAG